MTTNHDALREALDLIDEIVLAGMSGTGMESEEAMNAWHAQQAWKFISIAAQVKGKLQALAASKPEQQAQAEPTGCKHGVAGYCTRCNDDAVLQSHLQALAAKDAALGGALEALDGSLGKGFESNWPAQGRVAAAITKIKEARG